MTSHLDRKAGFSLVELSIVLVILGLLVGGVMTGQSLIRAAELRKITTDFSRFQTAVNSFKDKYRYKPGDLPNAFAFWGADCGTDALAPAGCNGNGNGAVEHEPTGGMIDEGYRFWQHLSLAGMIEGSYTGAEINSALNPGGNIPRGPIGTSGYSIHSVFDITQQDFGHEDYPTAATFILGGRYPDNTTSTWYRQHIAAAGVILPEEAWNIDVKMDDGKASTGSVRTYHRSTALWQTTDCTTDNANNVIDFDWLVSESSGRCNLAFFW